MRKKLLPLLLAGIAGPAMAQTIPPQIAAEQVMHDFNFGGYVLGPSGNANFRFAQTFELQRRGTISHIMLPINCDNAYANSITVRVTLQTTTRGGQPSGQILARQDVTPGSVLNSWVAANGMMSMRMVEFSRPPVLDPGKYAFTIEAIGNACTIWTGPSGDTYTGGQAFLINGVSLFSWYAMGKDLAFQIFERPQ